MKVFLVFVVPFIVWGLIEILPCDNGEWSDYEDYD